MLINYIKQVLMEMSIKEKTRQQIANITNLSPPTVYKALQTLINLGLVYKVKVGTYPYYYKVTMRGEKMQDLVKEMGR